MKNPVFKHLSLIATIVFFTAVLFTACNGKKTKTSVESDFKPNPVIREKQEVRTLSLGENAPVFNLPDMNGNYVNIEDFDSAELLVVVFTCNHCPTAQAYEDRLIDFTSDYKDKGVAVVAIMPTSAAGLLLEECGYSDLDDSFETMALRAKDKGFNFPYLYDGDDQAVSIKYGPTTTPHAFVFDKERKLQYVGRLDSIEKPGTANADDLRRAVDELLAGEPVSVPVTKTFGCSVKWSWKSEWTQKVNKQWQEKPVTLEMIDDAGIRGLLSNPSENLLLVNVWATWCAPCLVELPDMVNLQRMYGNRKFEFVTISSDDPSKKDEALEALKKVHAPIQNYIYSGTDRYKLIELIDEEWNGGLPYTLLIEPGGNVVYKMHGAVDLLELKKVIVEHPLLGRYF
ncbi:MAG: redoxin domain-containing protein [Prolixibacteraceae bacterium]|nr:redoxin domain-containing protein [Prolixibacteraceae bacterium]